MELDEMTGCIKEYRGPWTIKKKGQSTRKISTTSPPMSLIKQTLMDTLLGMWRLQVL